ncbi:hypothetical protein PENTCL1PPCAC_22245, partial [Pristionchus entomophagus]
RASISIGTISIPRHSPIWTTTHSLKRCLESLNVYLSEEDANSVLIELLGVKFKRDGPEKKYTGLQFFSREEGKMVDCYEDREYGIFSVQSFDGLFRTKIYAFRDSGMLEFDRFGLKIKWYGSEEKVAVIKMEYGSVKCVQSDF